VPHIYAKTSDDLFFAQGYITARDRLFQIDLWRRAGTGKTIFCRQATGYNSVMSGLPFRYQRIREMLSTGAKFSVEDFERMQQNVTSLPARGFQAVLHKWTPPPALAGTVRKVLDQSLCRPTT
jgi:acyl-homoserine lactone acylase PvdQ